MSNNTLTFIDLGLPSKTMWATTNVNETDEWGCDENVTLEDAQKVGDIPSRQQWDELFKCCQVEYIQGSDRKKSKIGVRLTGKNGNVLCIPVWYVCYKSWLAYPTNEWEVGEQTDSPWDTVLKCHIDCDNRRYYFKETSSRHEVRSLYPTRVVKPKSEAWRYVDTDIDINVDDLY